MTSLITLTSILSTLLLICFFADQLIAMFFDEGSMAYHLRKEIFRPIKWHFCFAVWCTYYFFVRKLNDDKHWHYTAHISGWWRSHFLDIGADEHPTFKERRMLYLKFVINDAVFALRPHMPRIRRA